jgi:hypothetical protein
MKMMPAPILLLFAGLVAACTDKEVTPPTRAPFDSIPTAKTVLPLLKEVSGIADSKTELGHVWAHQDRGNPPQLHLINYDGTVKKNIYIKGARNRDWEDMALAGSDLYIADIGDNYKAFTEYTIYKMPEPAPGTDTVYSFETIRFRYPDGAHDAEALLVDPTTKNIFILTKSDDPAAIYKLSFPYSTTEVNTAVKSGQLTYKGAVSAALSPDGKEIIVKTYFALYHYIRVGASIEAALQKQPASLPYRIEPQGEAVTFANNNGGYFTLSEKGFASSISLNFYKRN